MFSQQPFTKLLSRFKKPEQVKLDDRPLIDSAFASSCIKTISSWEEELDHIHEQGIHMESHWYQSLNNLTTLIDKLASPFHNTNRISLHQTQQFIEAYLDDWHSQRYEKEETHQERIHQASLRFSNQAELKSCVLEICGLEKDLFFYRHTMENQLTLLWDTRQKDQEITLWKQYLHEFHHASSQMETKFKDILENSTPKPDDYTCAVCLSIFTDPVTLYPCLHTFCKSCVQHIYCTCQLSECNSACHDAYPMEEDETELKPDQTLCRRSTCKPRYRSIIHHYPEPPHVDDDDSALTLTSSPPTFAPVDLHCDCPLSWSVPPAAQCPLCRHPFGPKECTSAIALDNLIRFYFPRQDRIRQKYHARQRRLKRRSFFSALSQKWVPSHLPTVPLPPRRLPPSHSSPITISSFSQHLASLAGQSFVI